MLEIYREQVRFILRVLPLVAEEKVFALKGGTAINLFDRDFPRLSVDIDLTYLPSDDRATALTNIGNALARVKARIEAADKGASVMLTTQGDGTEAKLHCRRQQARIKIEVNTVMRSHLFPTRTLICAPKVQSEFESFVEMPVLSKGELYGGKICAALDRQHPRDLFDIRTMLDSEGLSEEIKHGFIAALLSHPRPISEVLFPTLKDQRRTIETRFAGMAFEPFSYEDFESTRSRLNDVRSEEHTSELQSL